MLHHVDWFWDRENEIQGWKETEGRGTDGKEQTGILLPTVQLFFCLDYLNYLFFPLFGSTPEPCLHVIQWELLWRRKLESCPPFDLQVQNNPLICSLKGFLKQQVP